MKNLLFIIIALFAFQLGAKAQKSAKLYRAGTLIGTYSTLDSVFKYATSVGDSVLLSPHIFKEHSLQIAGGIMIQGTMNATDSSTIDAEHISLIAVPRSGYPSTAITIRDVICENGLSPSYGRKGGFDFVSIILKGYTVVRNCRSTSIDAVCFKAYLYDHVKIYNNEADSFGGVGSELYVYDSVEICYNKAAYGAVAGRNVGAYLYCNSQGVRLHHNTASKAGGAIYGYFEITGGQIINNQAPLGAAIFTYQCGTNLLQNTHVYNPRPDGSRQNEIYHRSGSLNINGTWFGQSDTAGLIIVGKDYTFCTSLTGKPAKANWSVNWGKILSKKDTLFPIGAAFTYRDGTPLPAKSLPWLQGKFSSSTGKMLTPNPKISASDTMSSLFRTYVYATKGDTSSKPINFVCIVDADTFRSSPRVWGIDSIKLSIEGLPMATNIVVYPNPTSQYLTIRNVPEACQLQLYNINGKLLLNERSNTNTTVLDLASFPRGQYMLKVITAEGKVGAAKLMKE